MSNDVIYNACKRTIIRGNYPENMLDRLIAFSKANLITLEQYEELLAMMEERNNGIS